MATGGDNPGHANGPLNGPIGAKGIPTTAEELPVPEGRKTTFGDVMGMIAGGLMILGTATVILGTIGYMIYSML
jgi:hypothetical protein